MVDTHADCHGTISEWRPCAPTAPDQLRAKSMSCSRVNSHGCGHSVERFQGLDPSTPVGQLCSRESFFLFSPLRVHCVLDPKRQWWSSNWSSWSDNWRSICWVGLPQGSASAQLKDLGLDIGGRGFLIQGGGDIVIIIRHSRVCVCLCVYVCIVCDQTCGLL